MDELAFWQQKLIQFFHDPPGKPFASLPGAGGQKKVAQRIFDAFQQHGEARKWRHWYKAADWAAAGADRPNLYTPRGVSPLGSVSWPHHPVITHPLASGQRVRIPTTRGTRERENPLDELDRDALLTAQVEGAEGIGALIPEWSDPAHLRHGFIILWRRLRETLVGDSNDPLWNVMPSDSRCPDHSIWDHLKVVTALAFMKPHKWKEEPRDEGPREPWLLRMTLGPVGRFIEQSRTTRDLWISSYILSDLAFAALSPFVERYGPDCVVYPDLFRNPRADCWLFENHRDALPNGLEPSTFAAVLPESFVVLAPKGGAGHLRPLDELARAGERRVADRWGKYMTTVRAWFEESSKEAATETFREIWDRQQERCPIHVTWTAVPWKPPGHLEKASSLRLPALPTQRVAEPVNEADRKAIEARAARLEPWVPKDVWSHYEHGREVFAHSYLDLFQIERGFDYALTHHQLSARQALRLQTHPAPFTLEEPGEKCTLCGQREALHAGEVPGERLGQKRQSARRFWQNEKLDPDQSGSERLCAVCATKRFLVVADGDGGLFNPLWAGMDTNITTFYRDGRARVPFPSTATIAAQAYLKRVVEAPECENHLHEIVRKCAAAGIGRTSFPEALPRLAACMSRDTHRFLEYEAEDVLFPEALGGKIQETGAGEKAKALEELRRAVQGLRGAVGGSPGTHIAVIRVDGDNMGRLLLGDREVIAARWRDVLHPAVLERLPTREYLMQAGWGDLLNAKRLMGPSLHALISRVLAVFSHRIVPFVVEHEFSGRLIYAGGDDVLAIAPAGEAIALAARLQQLFSAGWVLDTTPHVRPWGWRRPDWAGSYEDARSRFLIPLPNDQGTFDPEKEWSCAAHIADEGGLEPPPMAKGWRGELLPLLGSGASLSAGVAVGHYKTSLSVLLARSKELQNLAKKAGRRRIGFGHASRGGEKTRVILPWGEGERAAHRLVGIVVEGFRKGHIASRLPYKLREVGAALEAAVDERSDLETLAAGLFRSCVDEGKGRGDRARSAALELWLEGLRSCMQPDLFGRSPARDRFTAAVDVLLFCRELSGLGGET